MEVAEENFKYIIKHYNYDELSKLLKINKTKIINIKHNRTKITLEIIIKMCEAFGLNMNDFCTKRIKIKFEFEELYTRGEL